MIRRDTEMLMQDGQKRKIRIALPDDYESGEKLYPILYMFDGQNVFDEGDAFGGVTWGVREAMESLAEKEGIPAMIIVGIDNAGERRLDEYAPWPFQSERYTSEGEGMKFGEHLVTEIIPEIERRYPAKREKEVRFIAGSSMGGLISAYIMTAYPHIFAAAGIFSLASWVSEKPFLQYVKDAGNFEKNRFFIQVGTEEVREEKGGVDYPASQEYLSCSVRFLQHIISKGADIQDTAIRIGAGKTHNEGAWASYMPEFLAWLYEGMKKRK